MRGPVYEQIFVLGALRQLQVLGILAQPDGQYLKLLDGEGEMFTELESLGFRPTELQTERAIGHLTVVGRIVHMSNDTCRYLVLMISNWDRTLLSHQQHNSRNGRH